MTGLEPEPGTAAAHAAPRGRRRRIRIAAAVVAVALAGGGVALATPWHSDGSPGRSAPEPSVQTVKVTRMDVTNGQAINGTLGYGTARTVKGAGDGTVTWLAPAGSTVSRGKPLYRADDRPVPVFYGSVPLYRPLAALNTVGRDVRVIADNLRALGYDIGSQPVVGQTVTVTVPAADTAQSGSEQDPASDQSTSGGDKEAPSSDPSSSASEEESKQEQEQEQDKPSQSASTTSQVQVRSGDGVLTDSLIRAIKRWQNSRGVPVTGALGPGDVAVLSGAVRVESAAVQVGDPVDGPLLKVTPTAKAVTIEVEATQVGTIKRGDPVTIRLPDETTAAGTVAGIGTAATPAEDQGGGEAQKVTISVTFKDPGKAKKFDAAQVEVEFVSETHTGVLAVPVTALLALKEGGYGLQLTDGSLTPVEIGLFSKGMVEVSGDKIAEGVHVVTTS